MFPASLLHEAWLSVVDGLWSILCLGHGDVDVYSGLPDTLRMILSLLYAGERVVTITQSLRPTKSAELKR